MTKVNGDMDADNKEQESEQPQALPGGPKIIVVGAGAMGLLFGLRLQRAGLDVAYAEKSAARARLLMEDGVSLVEGKKRSEHSARVFLPDFPFEEIDYLFVMVKSYATREAIEPFAPRMGLETTVVSLQNGLDHVDELLDVFGSRRLVLGTTSEGANTPEPNTVVHAGKGPTLLGELNEAAMQRVSAVSDMLISAGFKAKAVKNIMNHLWEKLLVNAVINPLTAIHDVPNKQVGLDGKLRDSASEILEEGIKIARIEGVDLNISKMEKKVFDVARRTGDNISSMLQDVRAGRRTEIEAINGRVVALARKRSIRCPANEKVLAAVLEKTRPVKPKVK